jgi:type IV pilus assembly protein PilV
MVRSARKNERGLSLLETLVALAIVFIVFLGLAEAGLLVLDHNITNTIRDEGVKVTEMEMARVRNTPFSTLETMIGPPTTWPVVPRQVRGLTVNYTPTWTIAQLNGDNLQASINVTWTRNAWTPSGRVLRNYSHQVITIVRNR